MSALLLQQARSSCGFQGSCWDLRLLFGLGVLESTPEEKTAPLSHFCAAKFISLMIWPLFAFISASASWTGASLLLAEERERDGPAASERNWVRAATALGKQVSLPDRLFFSSPFYPECIYPIFLTLRRWAFHGSFCKRITRNGCSSYSADPDVVFLEHSKAWL